MLNKHNCVAGVPIFKALPPERLVELGHEMVHKTYEKGALIAQAGEPIDALLVVAAGQLKYTHLSSSGREQVVRIIGPGQFIGELALFTPGVYEGDLVAQVETEACVVPRAAVQRLLAAHPELGASLVVALAQRLVEAEEAIADLSLRDVGGRLARELLRQAGDGAADGTEVVFPVPWAEVAAKLGTTPESLSRRLSRFAEQGLLSQTGSRSVVLHDVAGLRAVADQT